MRRLWLKVLVALLVGSAAVAAEDIRPVELGVQEIVRALEEQGIHRSPGLVEKVKGLFEHAVGAQLQLEARGQSGGSVVGQDAVEIAAGLDLDPNASAPAVVRAIEALVRKNRSRMSRSLGWKEYFQKTAALAQDPDAARLFSSYGFHPVKISWEDIGRDQGSAWGARISDVGIWGREDPKDLNSARLMLTVRRDANFHDKVLMVPSTHIKLHRRVGGKLEEISLPQRLRELGLLSSSGRFDQNVIVSNQFSIVPVPQKEHTGMDTLAFNFSIYPYGSTNYVIADTIEGASEVVVGGHQHQLIYFNAGGKKAPFTAARASDRKEVVAAAEEMRKAGLDVDVQRFYLIQIPLKHEARGIQLGNMGMPPMHRTYEEVEGTLSEGAPAPSEAPSGVRRRGLEDVVIGHGEEEGEYRVGANFSGQRADERVRVTVCYFVTPRGELSESDMETFARKFAEWDKKAIWGGSFVVPEPTPVSQR